MKEKERERKQARAPGTKSTRGLLTFVINGFSFFLRRNDVFSFRTFKHYVKFFLLMETQVGVASRGESLVSQFGGRLSRDRRTRL